MFSTLLGALPSLSPDAGADSGDSAVEQTLADLAAAGLELLSDGLPAVDPSGEPGTEATVASWRRAAAASSLPVKQAIRGPFRSGTTLESSRAAAERAAEVISALAAAGCPFVDVLEPDLGPIVTEGGERDRFVDAHRWLFAALGSTAPAIHCSLVAGGGNLDGAGPATFFDLPYPSYAFDLIDGPDNWRLIAAAPGDRGVVCGALSAEPHGDETREVLVWAAQYAASTGGRGLDRVGLANAGSLAGLPREIALRKLRVIADAARVAASSPQDLATALDPRALRRRPGRRAISFEPPAEP